MRKTIKKSTIKTVLVILLTMTLSIAITIISLSNVFTNRVTEINQNHTSELKSKQLEMDNVQQERDSLKTDKEQIEKEKQEIEKEHNSLKSKIKASKDYEAQFSAANYADKDLRKYEILTIDEMNNWIAQRAPQDSPMIGQGEIFLKASNEAGLDPKYLVAHSALESTWGNSSIAKNKSNYFGIGAYNASPTSSSYTFSDTMEEGIIEGAKWISDKYTNEGQETLNKMIYGSPTKVYCMTDAGEPDQDWINKIINIIY